MQWFYEYFSMFDDSLKLRAKATDKKFNKKCAAYQFSSLFWDRNLKSRFHLVVWYGLYSLVW